MMEHEDALTQAEIEKDLRALGLREGMMLEAHSSLGSIGLVEGGAETVVRALTASPHGGRTPRRIARVSSV